MTGSPADFSDTGRIGGAVESAIETLGGLDVLVNNAGIAGPTPPVADYPLEARCKVMDVNLSSPIWLVQVDC